MPHRKSATFTVLKNPSESDVSKLLAYAGSAGLRGIEDYSGNVCLWPFNDGTHMMVASVLDIPYDLPPTTWTGSLGRRSTSAPWTIG